MVPSERRASFLQFYEMKSSLTFVLLLGAIQSLHCFHSQFIAHTISIKARPTEKLLKMTADNNSGNRWRGISLMPTLSILLPTQYALGNFRITLQSPTLSVSP